MRYWPFLLTCLLILPVSAQSLHDQLQTAVIQENWTAAIQIVDQMMQDASPQQLQELRAYRNQLELRVNPSVSPPTQEGTTTSFLMRGDFTAVISQPNPSIQMIVVEPTGEYAAIEVKRTNAALRRLIDPDPQVREQAIEEVLSDPESYAPPTLYATASALYSLDREEEGFFWLLLGQLRANSDAVKCGDDSAHQAVPLLDYLFAEPFTDYLYQDWRQLEVIDEVISWDQEHGRKYDPRWIALHGLMAHFSETLPFAPQEVWEEINAETREFFRAVSDQELSELAEIDQNRDGKISPAEGERYRQKLLEE